MRNLRLTLLAFVAFLSWGTLKAANPFLPLWEYIPDGEPYVFEDPDRPGHYRLYVYGSHDTMKTEYCGREQVLWSAPVENLNDWRYEGIIFESKTGADGEPLNEGGVGDILYAPDIVEVKGEDGKKTYYLFPNNQSEGRKNMVAKADRPDGPFVACNWSKDNPKQTEGVLNFDPAVLVDDDGRVYAYWGIMGSYAAELDPQTMATVKPGTQVVSDMVPSARQEGVFRFFEASSIRKIKDKYVFIYSRKTADNEFGLPVSNYTLAYAYSDHPLGPFTYGGTIIDGRGRGSDVNGRPIATATPTGNTHGSIVEVNGQWYVVYHRQTGLNEFSRQAMAAPITVKVNEGPGGRVEISEAEYTSEGFEINGLNPCRRYPAGIACYYTGPKPATSHFPNFTFYGSYVKPSYSEEINRKRPYDLSVNQSVVVNNTAGSIVGYKYFNLDSLDHSRKLDLVLRLKPLGVEGTVTVMMDSPWEVNGGVKLGTFQLKANAPQVATDMRTDVSTLLGYGDKHAIYLVFSSPTENRSLCDLMELEFQSR